jgi:hypothetical protein
MSTVTEQPHFRARWRERLRPRDEDHAGGGLYRAETIILALVALVFAVATVYDLVRQVHISDRMHADLVSWKAVTHRHDRHLIVEQDAKTYTTRDVVCGTTASTPSAPAAVCLIFRGPVKAGRREAAGGYYLLETGRRKNLVKDVARYRYACFGDAAALGFRCTVAAPPGAPDQPL